MRTFKQRYAQSISGKVGSNFRLRNPRVTGLLLLFGFTTVSYYLAWWTFTKGVSLILQVILKFIIYLSVILWLNSAWYLRELALGTDPDTFEFQKRQVKMTMWILLMFIVMELPVWLIVLGSH